MMNSKIQDFFEFIYDRQLIWHKRNILKTLAPWSEDKIFQTYKFCNVYRELDGGTISISKYLQSREFSPEKKLFNIIAYRFFNRRDTIENLFGGLLEPEYFSFKYYEKKFDEKKKSENIFSNAYLISSHPYDSSYRPKDKHIQILLMLDNLKTKMSEIIKELRESSPQEGINVISKHVKLAGPFLSGQILLDVTYAKDIIDYSGNDFLVVGPGAHWGLNIIFDKKLSKKEAFEKCKHLHAVQKEEFLKLKTEKNKDWQCVKWNNQNYPNTPYLCLHDIQNSLCEFRKYYRLKDNQKAKKRYFRV